MALAIGKERATGGKERAFQADRGQCVLQRAARALVHVHVASGDCRQAARRGEFEQHRQACRVIGPGMQFDGQPGTGWEARRQPTSLVHPGASVRDPQRQAVRQGAAAAGKVAGTFEVAAVEAVLALERASPRQGGQSRQIAVTGAVLCQQDQSEVFPWLTAEAKFGTDDQLQAASTGCAMCSHDAGQRGFVGDRQRTVAEFLRLLDQFFRMRGAAQEGKVGAAVKFGIGGQGGGHGDNCVYLQYIVLSSLCCCLLFPATAV